MVTPEYVVYALTFLSTVAGVIALWRTFAEAAEASAEHIDANRMAELQREDVGTQLERFVSKGRLFRLSLAASLVPLVVVLAVLMLCGIRNVIALACVPVLFAVIGWFVPRLYYKWRVARRQAAYERDILDFTMGICNALRAGMALPQAIERVGSQMKGPMKEELSVVIREYRLGTDLVRCLDRMYRRMPCEDIRLLVCAIKLTTAAGGSLASVLVEMTAMIRGRREFADKVKALTAQGRFEAIAMSCAPVAAFVFMHLIQPDMMRPLYTTGLGWLTLGFVACLIAAGYFVIRKIIAIEV